MSSHGIVFICSPLRGNVEENTKKCKKYCKFACYNHYTPFAPHLFYTRFLNDDVESERTLGIQCGLSMLEKCDEIWVFAKEDGSVSQGMQIEINKANNLKKKVKYFNYDCTIDLSKINIDDFEERAAIMQYDGGFTKEEAEILSLNYI
jgi:hypothetical protein